MYGCRRSPLRVSQVSDSTIFADATALVVGNVDLKTVGTRLGDSDPRLTLAVYAQATSEADRQRLPRWRIGSHQRWQGERNSGRRLLLDNCGMLSERTRSSGGRNPR